MIGMIAQASVCRQIILVKIDMAGKGPGLFFDMVKKVSVRQGPVSVLAQPLQALLNIRGNIPRRFFHLHPYRGTKYPGQGPIYYRHILSPEQMRRGRIG